MVGVEAALEIRVLHRHGKSIREIARETGVARNTVRRYLRDEEAARYKPRPPRSTKLDPFKAYVAERLGSAAPEWIPASVLLMELRERGYSGGYTMLKLFVASLRPQQAVEPVVRFETGPGEQMQVDWAVIRRGSNRLSVFVATLGWSRIGTTVETAQPQADPDAFPSRIGAFPYGPAGHATQRSSIGGYGGRRTVL